MSKLIATPSTKIATVSNAPKASNTSSATAPKRNASNKNRTISSASKKPIRRASPAATTPVKRLIVRARAVMGDRGVRSVSALQRSLVAIGVAISVPQLIRVVDGSAKHINKDVIEGIMTVLNCNLNELFATA
jgi:hypothetical protein